MKGLKNLSGLDSLKFVKHVTLESNDSLTDLSSLSQVNSRLSNLDIYDNKLLPSLVGLDSILLDSVRQLTIIGNPSLSTCAIHSICEFFEDPHGFYGIADNAPGCYSEEEVIELCLVDVGGKPLLNLISVYPNPVSKKLTIEIDLPQYETGSLEFTNSYGAIVKTRNLNSNSETQKLSFNMKDLPSGIYFLRVRIGSEVVTRKVVKL